MEHIETIIIGGGQAGLAVSYYLKKEKHEHLVLEKATRPAHVWTDERWDSFALLTPNWTIRMPGAEYDGAEPHGFMQSDKLSATFEQYVKKFNLPIRYGVCVMAVEQLPNGKGFYVTTDQENFQAANVVVATGLYQRPKIPEYAPDLPAGILQLHSGQYRNPQALPPGGILVVGSGQSGCQIAEELYQSGRKIHLSVGSAGRAPRRYRGKDIIEWLYLAGFFDRTVDKLPTPRAKFAGNPHLSGKNGGHSLNLHQFSRDGVKLLGRIDGAKDDRLTLMPNLNENLAKVDKFEVDMIKMIDEYIQKNILDAPEEQIPQLRDGYIADEPRELDLHAAGIKTIIWAAGYSFDFNLVRLPVTDGDGYPVQQRGVTQFPGLYFIGLAWLYKFKSALLGGVGEDAEYVAAQITARYNKTQPGM
jgi:putative flavoprotein involved in K+ transport